MLRQLQEELRGQPEDVRSINRQSERFGVTDYDDEISLNFDEQNSRQGPMKPQDGFEIADESDIDAMDGFDGDDLLENLLESNYEIMSQLRRDTELNRKNSGHSNAHPKRFSGCNRLDS